ncbi:phage portal protein [Streptomyces sp. NPDC060286]|uniref:phage portal protein n=1 Tax=unclassified Streptomyces TaxID=2593676 RepID=UPI0035D669AD
MGLLSVFSRNRGHGVVRAAVQGANDSTRPVVAPPGNLAPVLAERLSEPPGVWGCGGWMLSRRLAMKVPAVRRGVRTIADSIATMPLERWRGLVKLPPSTFLDQPESWRAYVSTITETVEDLIFYPWAWWYVVGRDWAGWPSAVIRLDPQYVSVTTVPGSGEIDRVYVTYRGRELPQEDLIRFDGPDEGILTLGDVEIWTALRLELAAQSYADPEVPTGVLTNTGEYRLTPAEREELMAGWTAARRRRRTAFLDANLSYQSVLSTPEQLQLVQAREESAVQLARLLNLPPHYVGAKSGDSMTYSTVASQRRDLSDISLAPYVGAIEGRLSMSDRNGSPQGQRVKFDRSGLLRSDAREDAEVGEILIRSGQSTADEQRARRGLPPLDPPPAAPAPEGARVPAQEGPDDDDA